MPIRYYVTANGQTTGSQKLPINQADVSYTSGLMGANSAEVDCYVEFFDSNNNPVTPTGGQVFFYGIPMSNGWIAAQGSPINAANASYPIASYSPPYMDGLVQYARVRFVGVTGADFASVIFYKREAA